MIKSFIQKISWAISRGLMAVGLSATVAQFVAYGLMAIAALVIVLFIFVQVRSCFTPDAIDEQEIQRVNSQNEKERKEALNQVFEKIDQQREVSDTERQQIVKEVEKSVNIGRNVTAEDLHRLVEESKNEKNTP